jgi:PAS domain S-box-containing protein
MRQTVLSVSGDAVAPGVRNQTLRDAGFEVVEAATAAGALKLASEKQPALIVLALDLPGMDGLDVCRRLKADPGAASIPVLHISSSGGPLGGYAESLESGADAYLRAPLDPPTLISVAKALIRARAGGTAGRQRAEGALQKEREELRERVEELETVMEVAPVAIWVAHDPQCQEITGNRMADRFYEAGAGENVSANVTAARRFFHGGRELTAQELPMQEAAARGTDVRNSELDVLLPSGARMNMLGSASPLRDASGRVRGSVGTFLDITERKRAEEALRESEERNRLLANLLERADQPFAIGYPDGRLGFVNSAFERLTGYSRDELQGVDWAATLTPSEWLEMERAKLEELHRTGQPVRYAKEYLRKDGARVPIELLVHLVRDRQDQPFYYSFLTDLTERKRSEEALRESEAILRSFFDSAGVMRGFVDLIEGRIVHASCNAAAAELFGVDRESIAGKSAIEAGARDEVARIWEGFYEESRRTGQPVSMEYARRDAGGQERWLLATASYLGAGPSGNPRFAYTALDLTARKRAEEALRESEERYRTMFDTMLEGFCIIEVIFDANEKPVDYRFLEINAAFEAQTGLKDARGRLMRELAPDHEAHWFEIYGQVALTGQPARFVNEARALGRWYDVSAHRVGEPESRRVAILFNDISKRMRALEALSRSESQLRALGDNLPNGAIYRYRLDAAGEPHVDFISAGIERIAGVSAAEYMADAAAVERNMLLQDFERMTAAIALSRERMERFDVEVRHPHRVTGEIRWSLLRSTPSPGPDGATVWDGIELDITERKQAEEALRESEAKERARAAEVEALMDAAPAAIFVARDAECRSMTGNRAAYDLLRRPLGGNLSKSAPEGQRPVNFRAMKDGVEVPLEELPVQKAAFTGQPVRNSELDLVFEDGASVNLVGDAVPLLDEHGNPRGAVAVLSDITELKRAETRLREAQKLESLGLLAGGVAHDFNNLLVGVIGNASLAQEWLPEGNPAAELLEGVIKSGEQAAHLTRQMLAYSGKGKFVVEPLDLSSLIPEMSGLVRPSISKKIPLHLDLAPDLPPIEADRGQVQQVFMNLALNAAEAIGSHDGVISVRTGVEDVDERYLRLHPAVATLRPGKHVCLEVRDTGCGMDEATMAKIFDPFYTTKFLGRGLGLAAVAGILRGHKGAISVSSAPGKGSCFTVLLPAAAHAGGERPAPAGDPAIQGAGTVLVVDDESVVRETAKRALERHGYTVLVAESGLAAIDVFRRHPGEIALVVLDLSMPLMSGEETLPELRKIRPHAKVAVSSGYSEAETMALFKGQKVSGFIQKPYTSKGLAEKVKAWIA